MPKIEEVFERLDSEKIARSKLLKWSAAGVAAVTAKFAVGASPATAQHQGTPAACFGYPWCHYCSGDNCYKYCWYNYPESLGCPGGGHPQFWLTCLNGNTYKCRDWWEKFPGHSTHACICRGLNNYGC